MVLTKGKNGEANGVIAASACSADSSWLPLGKVAFHDNSSINVLDGPALSKVVDRAIAASLSR